MRKISILVILFLSIGISFVYSQKKPLDHDVYDAWKSVGKVAISDNGQYAMSIVREQEGDDYLLIRNLKSNAEVIVSRAYEFTMAPDQKHVVSLVRASHKDIRQAKIKKVKEEKMPKDSLVIISLTDFSKTTIPNVKDYKLGKDQSDFLAYRINDTLKIVKDKPKPYQMIIRQLTTAKEDSVKNVLNYAFDVNGKMLVANIAAQPKDSLSRNNITLFDLVNNSRKVLSQGNTIYKHLEISESGANVSFLATADSLKKEIKDYVLYHYSDKQAVGDTARIIVRHNTAGIPEKWSVSEYFKPYFSKKENRLMLGTAPVRQPKDTTIPDFEKATLDIWHWDEPEIQPQQLVKLKKTLEKSYLGYVDLTNGKYFQLATEEIPQVDILDESEGRYAIGVSNLPYLKETQWDVLSRASRDIWVFDLQNNTNKKIKTKLSSMLSYSPKGGYLAWYDMSDRNYYSYNLATDKELCLTESLGVNFWNEKHDTPSVPYPYGVAAWVENDEAIIVYDAHDLWKLYLDGNKKPENMTNGIGRQKDLMLRYVKTDPESRFVTNKEKILLTVFDNKTKENGYAQIVNKKTNILLVDKFGFDKKAFAKAKNADVYLYSKGNFNTSNDLYVTANSWKKETKISDINPQMKDYNWGTAELMSWTTFDGKQTEGVVYKPEDFDPQKKYPVMIYFYEQVTDRMHYYMSPAPSASIINIPFFCSRGYIVFTPDILYTDGHPGESAYNTIVSGAEKLAENSWVDRDNMAIQGQSWGGYQVAYLITRTNMFKAAGAGAPVSNMFSAYGGIRWESGMSRQYQYEQGQSRIGFTMWERPDLYTENSPVFFLPKVETPLLIMHNDNDGAVPWYQGIEMFMGLRRLNKPVWLLQYNKEAHNLRQRRNRKDLSIRLQQFFDHYLKGDPAPKWMKSGVKATEKGRDYGFGFE